MKLLITGGAGFIGSAVVRQAVWAGHEVVNVDALTYASCLENVAEVADNPAYCFEHVDIRASEALARVLTTHRPDAVMHLAAEEIAEAHECYMAAGWDLGAGPITVYGEILDRVHETATQCGQRARAELAATHRRCLSDRYGI